jgi:hypothetical protein
MSLFARAKTKLLAIREKRMPDFVIGGHERPYLLRWWVIPRNKFFNVYLHQFLRSDDDRALHDHPWLFNCSILLEGEYIEHLPNRNWRVLMAGQWKFRWGGAPHRVELFRKVVGREAPCATLFITGPVVREWGFHCPRGWVPWQRFVATRDKGDVGAGCEG